jgi:hypothetical protein
MRHDEVNLLIDAIVRQTVIMVAQIATTGGRRAPLARIANQVFLGLVTELQSQGVTQAVGADMFGLALRTYQRKRRRLSESATDRGKSLWEAVLGFVEQKKRVSRAQTFERFRHDEEEVLRGILRDLVATGLVSQSGRGHRTIYQSTNTREMLSDPDEPNIDAAANLLWVSIYREGPISRNVLEQLHTSLSPEILDRLLESLVRETLIKVDSDGDDVVYSCSEYVIPMGDSEGWAASVFDHYQAMVGTITNKLSGGASVAGSEDVVGGSTFAFDVWPGHPFEEDVMGLLAELRPRCQALRAKVDAYNQTQDFAGEGGDRVVFYLGQNVFRDEEDAE